MPTVTRTMTVNAPTSQIIDYLKDFSHAEEWDSATQRCTRNDSGPIRPGASWHNVSKVFGFTTELTYTLHEVDDRRIVLLGTNDSSTDHSTITVDSCDSGSILTYRAHLTLRGAAKLLSPAMKLVFEKLASDTEKQLRTVLNHLDRQS